MEEREIGILGEEEIAELMAAGFLIAIENDNALLVTNPKQKGGTEWQTANL